MALRHSPLSLTEIVDDVPVYRHLGENMAREAVKETVRADIATLRAGGDLIDYHRRESDHEYAYHLDDSATIKVDTSGLNLALLLPLLDFKGRSQPEVFAQIGVRRALEAGQRGAESDEITARRPLIATVPRGHFAPVVATAIQHHDLIAFSYQSLNQSQPSERLARPLALEVHGGEFYVRAIPCDADTADVDNGMASTEDMASTKGTKGTANEADNTAQNTAGIENAASTDSPKQRSGEYASAQSEVNESEVNKSEPDRSELLGSEAQLRTYKVARMESCDVVPAAQSHCRDCADQRSALAAEVDSTEKTSAEKASMQKSRSATAASWFASITVIFAVRPGTCAPLVARSERCAWDETDLPIAEHCGTSTWQHYCLRDVDPLAFLEECAFYGSDMRVLAPVKYAHDILRRLEHAARIVAPVAPSPPLPSPSSSSQPSSPASPTPALPTTPAESAHARRSAPIVPTGKSVDASVPRRESYFTYLLRHGPATLGELAEHFSLTPLTVRRELRDLFTTEIVIDGQPQAPYDLVMPPWEEGEAINTAWVIEAHGHGTAEKDSYYPTASFTFAEVIALLGAIDSLLAVAIGDHQRALLDMRTVFTQAAAESGYADAMWAPPTARFSPTIADAVFSAIERRNAVTICYWQAAADGTAGCQHIRVRPFAVDPGMNPLLVATGDDGIIRTFRLDRISAVLPTDEYSTKMVVRSWAQQYRRAPRHFTGTQIHLVCAPRARWVLEEIPESHIEADVDIGETGEDTDTHTGVGNQAHVISLSVHNVQWLRTLLVRLGRDCYAVYPASIRAQLAPALTAIVQVYHGES